MKQIIYERPVAKAIRPGWDAGPSAPLVDIRPSTYVIVLNPEFGPKLREWSHNRASAIVSNIPRNPHGDFCDEYHPEALLSLGIEATMSYLYLQFGGTFIRGRDLLVLSRDSGTLVRCSVITGDFYECPSCAVKPGSPALCQTCLRRRAGFAAIEHKCDCCGGKLGADASCDECMRFRMDAANASRRR